MGIIMSQNCALDQRLGHGMMVQTTTLSQNGFLP